jgi:hypothetical protein
MNGCRWRELPGEVGIQGQLDVASLSCNSSYWCFFELGIRHCLKVLETEVPSRLLTKDKLVSALFKFALIVGKRQGADTPYLLLCQLHLRLNT